MLMLSSSMELIDPYRYKDTATAQQRRKKEKRSKKRPPTPQSRRLSSILGITSHSEGKLLILTYVNRYKAFIFEGIII